MSMILALDKNWEPHRWLSVQDAISHEATNEVIEHLGEAIYVYHGGINSLTGKQSVLETSSIIVIDGAPKARNYRDPALTNTALFQRDRDICAYCGGKYNHSHLTRDHIHPRSKGGKDIWMNVVTACKECNSLKDDLMPGQRLPKIQSGQILGPQGTGKMEPLFVPYVPCKNEHMILKHRNIKYDQMVFLLDRVKNKQSRIFKYAQEMFPSRFEVKA
jgi:5-methylcytosine-specific restriction endonuclease McrA